MLNFDDEIDEDIIYDVEENSLTKYNIVLCEKYDSIMHGVSVPKIDDHSYYLTHYKIKKLNCDVINELIELINYNSNYYVDIKLEIAECICLPSLHCISIIKTFWLRLIQRKWKNICKNRKNIIMIRCLPYSLHYREIYGNWPVNCINYPILKGMLSNLN